MDKIIRFVSANCLLIWILLGNTFSVSAQRFEWVRGYAAGENVAIVGSVTDSVGNLYILGSMNRNSCWENGSRLLPIVPQGGPDIGDVLIAKVSPDGDLVWHKVIHGNYTRSEPHDIKLLGDTAFACLVTMPLATFEYYLYYLDTMINAAQTGWDHASPMDSVPWPDYPLYVRNRDFECMALITFDFDGRVLEQHFLQMSYVDRYGEDIADPPTSPTDSPWLRTPAPLYPSFAIDSEGNIYLSRWAFDQTVTGYSPTTAAEYYVLDGTISAVKFWCDGRVVGVVPADSALGTSPQILKFAPHFDTLTNSRYLFQSRGNLSIYHSQKIQTDPMNNLYLIGYLENGFRQQDYLITVDSTKNFIINVNTYNPAKGFLIKFNSQLTPMCAISLEDNVIEENSYMQHSRNEFHDVAFDYDSNLVFITVSSGRGSFGDTVHFFSVPQCQGVSLQDIKNNAFFLSFRMDADTLSLYSYGVVPSKMYSDCSQSYPIAHGNLTCGNNRVFLQSKNYGGLRFPGQTLEWDYWTPSHGLTIFDYDGNVIGGTHYASYSSQNRVGPISLRDSTLYLINKLVSDATFGDIQVPSRGEYFACIAKYTDSMFMSSYERPRDTSIVVEVVQEELTVVRYPNPTTGRLTLVMNGRPLREAYVAGMDGIAQPLPVAAIGNGIYCADLTGRPDGTYILVLVADDKHAYRCNVILQH